MGDMIMMHVVPSCLSPAPSFESGSDSPLSQEFDFNLLPSPCYPDFPELEFPLSIVDQFQEVPSPVTELSLRSPTMFSPICNEKSGPGNWLEPLVLSPPPSLPPSSPCSPANPITPGDSGNFMTKSSIESIQESLMELQQLQSQFARLAGPPPPYVMPPEKLVIGEMNSQNCQSFLEQVLTTFPEEKPSEKLFIIKEEVDDEDSLSEVKLNPAISFAMEQVKRDIKTLSEILHISTNPVDWTRNDVIRWMDWTMQQFDIRPIRPLQDWVSDGELMVQLSEAHFKDKIPLGGETIFAQLDVWKSYATCNMVDEILESVQPPISNLKEEPKESLQSNYDLKIDIDQFLSLMDDVDMKSQDFETELANPPAPTTSSRTPLLPESVYDSVEDNLCDENMDDDDDVISEKDFCPAKDSGYTPKPPSTPNRMSGNIHLWQFVKELLNEPNSHSGCITWVDHDKGIFKIVDSVRVAQLWGKRKNRPAMNYDKLSRSLRQYYKKGIMKKTERTQRLVYQFCSPYYL